MMPVPLRTRFDSWKQIADYLGRDVTTVIRWEKEKGMPVHRLPGGKRHTVVAWPHELDAWMANGSNGSADSADLEPETVAASKNGKPSGARSTSRDDGPEEARALPYQMPQAQFEVLRYKVHLAYVLPAMALTAVMVYLLVRPTPAPKILGYTQLTNDSRVKGGRLVTDGPRLYFSEETPQGLVIAQVATVGGEVETISTAFKHPSIQDLNLGHSELLVIDFTDGDSMHPGALFALRLSGGLPRRIGNIQASSVAWSPDGQALAYTTEDGVYVSQSDGTGGRKIAALTGCLGEIVWHPGGSLLRFTVSDPRSNKASIWEARPDGANLRAFLPDTLSIQANGGAWTSDGRDFIFSMKRGVRDGLWSFHERTGSVTLQRSSLVELTIGPMALDGLAPSRDGRRLFTIGRTGRSELERYDYESGKFVPFLPDLSADNVDFSRDGEWVAYNGFREAALWKRRVNGTEPLQLTLPPMQIELPRWSPDGKWIAFMGREPERPWKVRVISAEGGLLQTVSPGADQEGAPTWSPDGTKLIFGGLVTADVRSSGPLMIHMVDLRTHEVSTVPGSEGLWTARWSPSGRYIAALTGDSKSLMLFDFSTQKWARLLTVPAVWDIAWSRKQEAIFLSHASLHEGERCISRLRIRDGKLEELVSLRGERRSSWLGLTQDDSPLIARPVGSCEIYALEWVLP